MIFLMVEISFLDTFLLLFSTQACSKNLQASNFFFLLFVWVLFFRYRTNLVAAKENELSKKVLWTHLLCARTDFSKELG